jgi:hypothetical protein
MNVPMMNPADDELLTEHKKHTEYRTPGKD